MANKTALTAQTWDWDVRVRERNLKAGLLQEKEVEKMLSALEDLSEKTDIVTLAQPALSGDDDDDDDDVGELAP
jgi:hypothetical protein